MFGFKKSQVELDKEVLINTKAGEKTLEELVNDLEAAEEKIAEQAETITKLEAEKAELEAKAAEHVEVAPETEAAPAKEVKTEEAPEGTDTDLKADLNNALQDTVKKIVVKVPDVRI